MRLLFVSWDGPEQSYLESLFFPLLGGLAGHGVEAHVLQLRFGPAALEAATRRAAEAFGVGYEARPILRGPSVTAGALATIAREAPGLARRARRLDAGVIMPRSLLPGAMALLARPASGRARLVFDADGLMADERVELGGWRPEGGPYRALRAIERRLVRGADGVMTRTHAAKRVLLERAGEDVPEGRVHVIPNGVDAARFRPRSPEERRAIRARYGAVEGAPFVVYCGSIGPQYMVDEALAFFRALRARRPDARLAVLTGAEAQARDALARAAIDPGAARIERLPPERVPEVLAAADCGLALRRPTLSQRAVSPIKVGEYLLSGLPVLATRGVGDLDALFGDTEARATRSARIARLLDAAAPDLEGAVTWLLEGPMTDRDAAARAARALGEESLGLDLAVTRLAHLLRQSTHEGP
jgi:glycosyltransferase involved in cell wall biosynthesis